MLLSEGDRDRRDLTALAWLEAGMTQREVCERLGFTRGPLVRMLRHIRQAENDPDFCRPCGSTRRNEAG